MGKPNLSHHFIRGSPCAAQKRTIRPIAFERVMANPSVRAFCRRLSAASATVTISAPFPHDGDEEGECRWALDAVDANNVICSDEMPRVTFEHVNETQFEEFTFDLLHELNFVNTDWRKGTPKPSSPADKGRDIVAQQVVKDVD